MAASSQQVHTPAGHVALSELVGHRAAIDARAPLAEVQAQFSRGHHHFMAVLERDKLLGMCSRDHISSLLSHRYGNALYANQPVRRHLVRNAIQIEAGACLPTVFRLISERDDESLYDDILLTDEHGGFVGFLHMTTLVRLQNELLQDNLEHVRTQRNTLDRHNQQMLADLKLAAEVQEALLPSSAIRVFPAAPGHFGLEAVHAYEAAASVGGDFYHFIDLGEEQCFVFQADVMGHGVRSAFVTVMLRMLMETLRADANDPSRFLMELNAHMASVLQSGRELIIVTAAAAHFDLKQGRLTLSSAGHENPLYLPGGDGKPELLALPPDLKGPALPLIPDYPYASMTRDLLAGDRVLFSTDGLIEALSATREEFGHDRMLTALETLYRNASLGETIEDLIAAARDFAEGDTFLDDVCLVGVELFQDGR